MLRSFYLKTYGCQMNELDSEVMIGQLLKRGLQRTQTEDDADLLIFNTCSIRDLAERKALGKIGQLSRRKRRSSLIGIAGCMANAKKEALFRKLPAVDFVIGTNNLHELDAVIDEVILTKRPVLRTDDTFRFELDYTGAARNNKVSAYVSIIRGCSKYCTYCVVPYTRGEEVSRDPESIISECRELVQKGYREITLLGQNVNSYGNDRPDWGVHFADLLCSLDAIAGLERIRFMTSHPVDISPELMSAVADLPSVCEFVHFPLQAGSDRILKKMHRMYTTDLYLERVSRLKALVPNISLGTDIIVGFPTESEEDFLKTAELFEQIAYSTAFIFAYSQRSGTPATRWKDDIPESVKQERLQHLLQIHERTSARLRQQMLGQTAEVLVESVSQRDPHQLVARTRCWKNVVFTGTSDLVGTLQRVRLHSFSHQTLLGNLAECPAPSAF